MTILFSDGFESNDFSAWTSTATSGTGSTLTTGSGYANVGTYGARTYKPNSNNNGYARAWQDFTAPANNIVSMKVRFYVAVKSGSGRLVGPQLYQEGNVYNRVTTLMWDGTNWVLEARNKDGTTTSVNLSTGLSDSTWYTVELVYDRSGSNPVHTCYVDNVSQATQTDTTTGTAYTPNRARIDCFEDSWSATGDFYYDAISVADAYQNFSTEQEGFRWRNDDGSETAATWKENQDTNTSGAKEVNARLRMLINATGDAPATAYQLEHKKGAGGTYEKTKTAVAFPVVASSNTTIATTPGAGLTVNMPSGITAGDLLLIVATNDNPGTTNMGVSGWTQLNQTAYTGNVIKHGIWAKIAAGSDTATITGAAQDISVISMRITGHGVSDVSTNIKLGTPATGSSSTPDPPSLDAGSSKKWLWIETFGSDDDDNTATYWTTTTYTFTGIAQAESAQSTSSCMTSAAYYQLEAQTLDPATMAMAAIEEWVANTIAIPPATDYVLISTSSNITAGGEATTAQLTAPSGKTTSNFTTGRMWDDENGTDTIDIASGNYTELEWCIKVQAAAAAADVYYFRVTAAGTALDTYTLTPTYTISSTKYFTSAITSSSTTGDALLPVTRSVTANRASTSSTGDATLISKVPMSAAVASASSTGDALLPVARAVTSALASLSTTGDALIPVARPVTAAAASASSTGDALLPVARSITGAAASLSTTGNALLPVARPVVGAAASVSSTGDALLPVARALVAAVASTSTTPSAALDPGAGTTWQLTAACASLSTTGDALLPVTRLITASRASTSTTGDALIPVVRAVSTAVASTSSTGDALLPVARAVVASAASASSTGNALLPVARPVTAACASLSSTADATLNAATVYNLTAAMASLSTTGDALIPVSRTVMAARTSLSSTGDANLPVIRPVVASRASLSSTGDASLTTATVYNIIAAVASQSSTGDALLPVARALATNVASLSVTPDATANVGRALITAIASLSSTGDAGLMTALIQGAVSLTWRATIPAMTFSAVAPAITFSATRPAVVYSATKPGVTFRAKKPNMTFTEA